MKLLIQTFCSLFLYILSQHSYATEPKLSFEDIMKVCSSLSTYTQLDATCQQNGFTYPEITVEYTFDHAETANLTIKQAKLDSNVIDHVISSAQISCAYCETESDIEIKLGKAVNGLASAATNNVIRVKNGSKLLSEKTKNIFTNVTSELTADLAKTQFENKGGYTVQSPVMIIVLNQINQPVGSGRVVHGEIKLDLALTKALNGNLVWAGTFDTGTGISLIQRWVNFSSGGKECQVSYKGSSAEDKMSAQIVCS